MKGCYGHTLLRCAAKVPFPGCYNKDELDGTRKLFNRRVPDEHSCSEKFVESKVTERQVLWKRGRTIRATIVGRYSDLLLCSQSVEEVQ